MKHWTRPTYSSLYSYHFIPERSSNAETRFPLPHCDKRTWQRVPRNPTLPPASDLLFFLNGVGELCPASSELNLLQPWQMFTDDAGATSKNLARVQFIIWQTRCNVSQISWIHFTCLSGKVPLRNVWKEEANVGKKGRKKKEGDWANLLSVPFNWAQIDFFTASWTREQYFKASYWWWRVVMLANLLPKPLEIKVKTSLPPKRNLQCGSVFFFSTWKFRPVPMKLPLLRHPR